MRGPWDGPPWDEDEPVHSWEATWWPVEHGRQAGRGPAPAVPEQLLLAAAAAGAAGATVLGLLALLVGGVVVAVSLGAVLIGAAVAVSEIERGIR
ncbi:hypothetical protein [Pseudonocardia sp.]|uniref:hypothetical protein n=1 Tax=Pseudonocardia sp. TaxID=60912 RepID=UPI00262D2B5F|nr:hypothetical protein [Pseudonocardia sp.]